MTFALQLVYAALKVATPIQQLPALDADEIEWASRSGGGSMIGEATIEFKNQKLSCANMTVQLTPRSRLADARVRLIYGNQKSGFRLGRDMPQLPTNSIYNQSTRTAKCDASGRFAFVHLPKGDYYVSTFVDLPDGRQEPDASTAIALMRRVTVNDGQIAVEFKGSLR